MRILYDHQIHVMQKFGGISRYFNEIMKLSSEHTEVKFIDPDLFIPTPQTTKEKKVLKKDIISKGARFIKRKAGIKEQEKERPVILDAYTQFLAEVSSTLQKGNFDLFHPTYYDPYFLGITSKPFVLTVYDMIHEIYKEYFSLSDPTSHNKLLLCQKANQIITISQNTKNDLLDLFDVPEEKVHVIPLASSFDKIVSSKPQDTEELKRYILYVGTRNQYKNFYFPVHALSDILKSDKQLQILCTGHSFTNDELLYFKDLGIQEQIKHIYPENDSELSWLYRNAALFIFPSLYEGFGFPMLEAFASECPVIASKGGSLPEVGGDAALYFDPKNKNEIQEAAHEVLYNSSLRESLIQKGKLQFQKFSWEKCRAETRSVYQNIEHFVQ